jgi:L-2-hydroxyglutarate oxidase LhgO
MADHTYDIAVVGGGILGIATAMELTHRFPKLTVGVVEKENRLAAHQTGHNSGVIHTGIYYKPGSLKAKNCVTGVSSLLAFCDENNIKYDLCGKVIVATREDELGRLDDLYERGVANGVQGLEMIGPERLKEIEPHAAGIKALYSPNTGIIDYTEVTEAYGRKFQENGGEILTDTKVEDIKKGSDGRVTLVTNQGNVSAKYMVNCAGLYAHSIAHKMGVPYDLRIIPFRGEYFTLSPEGQALVKGLIYPVPDPRFPFLGVHFTRGIHGDVEAGPNAVLAFAQEGYTKFKINVKETMATLAFKGFWIMAAKHWKTAYQEYYRSFSKGTFTKSLQRLVPEIEKRHLTGGGSGVRAQAVERNGFLVDDFRISQTENAIHVRNAPSPGATASLSISRGIVDMAEEAFGLGA